MAKQHISFRLETTTIDQIKELKTLFGGSEGAIIERVVEAFYSKRADHLEADTKEKLRKLGKA